jgi:hypothetical protein
MAEPPFKWRINCRDADWLLSLQQDTQLPWNRRAALWLHLRYCDSCRTVRRNLDLLARAVRRL